MTGVRAAVGGYGERVARRLLEGQGMTVLDANWRDGRRGELDLVARDGDTIVFCEVKTRRSDAFGTPAAAVTPAKVRRLRQLAAAWLAAHPAHRGDVRFDVVAVRPRPSGPAHTEHLRGVL
jgi:putative endonuclease